ncbi:hypothetical protein KIPB_014178 [Kipferlia bialata]|uniref:Uncharacterized protein n=1 Tax=Kipferlia bialata TaxID=797122 RepID=A0A391NWM9_9EUKA|nr:hypothetical protein KIPB_014178 [Kipferlia bialata]|eukprot:g14178.t1
MPGPEPDFWEDDDADYHEESDVSESSSTTSDLSDDDLSAQEVGADRDGGGDHLVPTYPTEGVARPRDVGDLNSGVTFAHLERVVSDSIWNSTPDSFKPYTPIWALGGAMREITDENGGMVTAQSMPEAILKKVCNMT